jgi:hypothetical protein
MSGLASAFTTAVLAAVALAVGNGLARMLPGRVPGRRRPPIAGVGLLGAGIGARLAVELLNLPGGLVVLIASYGLLVAACLLNLTRPGTPVLLLGLVLMLAATVVNGGMPVSAHALDSMGLHPSASKLPGERHVEVERDQLRVLGDVVPLPLGGRPVSFGELIALVGLADVAFHAVGRRSARRRPASGPAQRLDPALVLEEPIEDDEPSVVVLGPVASERAAKPARSTRPKSKEPAAPSFWNDPFAADPFSVDPFLPEPASADQPAVDPARVEGRTTGRGRGGERAVRSPTAVADRSAVGADRSAVGADRSAVGADRPARAPQAQTRRAEPMRRADLRVPRSPRADAARAEAAWAEFTRAESAYVDQRNQPRWG